MSGSHWAVQARKKLPIIIHVLVSWINTDHASSMRKGRIGFTVAPIVMASARFWGNFQGLEFDSPTGGFPCSKWGAVTGVATLAPSKVWVMQLGSLVA